jgi:hypothetical protein
LNSPSNEKFKLSIKSRVYHKNGKIEQTPSKKEDLSKKDDDAI